MDPDDPETAPRDVTGITAQFWSINPRSPSPRLILGSAFLNAPLPDALLLLRKYANALRNGDCAVDYRKNIFSDDAFPMH
jgi:hypothetical protein